MCMNCGCGEADKRHQPTDITLEDVQRAADGGGMTIQQVARNLEMSSQQLGAEQEGLTVESRSLSASTRA